MNKNLLFSLVILSVFALQSCTQSKIEASLENWHTENIYKSSDSVIIIGCRITAYTATRFDGIFPTYIDGKKVIEIVGDENIKSIFSNPQDTLLKHLDFSNAHYLKSIKNNAFYGCKYVYEVKLNDKLEYLGDGAFADCISISHLEWGEHIKYIGGGAFYNNDQLTSVILPESLDTLDEFAFYACSRLQNVSFNKNLRYIGERAFANSQQIKSLELPKTITFIGEKAFLNLAQVTSVTLGKDIEKVRNKAFYQCKKLSTLRIKGTQTSIEKDSFSSTPLMTETSSVIHYPKSANYPEMEYWDQLKARWLAE